jgi:hypothetical protein
VIGIFRERHTLQVPLFFTLAIASRVVFLNHPPPLPAADSGGLLAPLLHRFVAATTPGVSSFIAFLIMLLSSLLANYQIGVARMFSRTNMLVALTAWLTATMLPQSATLSPALCMVPLQILLFGFTTHLYNQSAPRTSIINIGLLAGTGTLLYHPFIWIVPACFMGLAGMRPFKLNEWLLLAAAMLTPFYFALSFEYVFEGRNYMRYIPKFELTMPVALNYTHITVLVVAAIWLIAGIASLQSHLRRMLIQIRKYWYHLAFTGVWLLPGLLISPHNREFGLVLLIFPFGGLAANAFISKERTVPQILLFWTIAVAIGAAQWAFTTGRW